MQVLIYLPCQIMREKEDNIQSTQPEKTSTKKFGVLHWVQEVITCLFYLQVIGKNIVKEFLFCD
jgi:hypothetical protein